MSATFMAAQAFEGSKEAYVYKMGQKGLGYYFDANVCPKSSAETFANNELVGVYVLELNSGAIYVGKSDDLQRRIQQHRKNGPHAAVWVKEQGGVRKCLAPSIPPTDDLNDWERKETLVQMMIHGPEKVRGWEFTEPGPLTLEY
jgi:hypothetical protein